jgi:betaine-aldehyde dehydrogenase
VPSARSLLALRKPNEDSQATKLSYILLATDESGEACSAEVAPGQWFSTYGELAGVVAIIVPWNATVALFMRSLPPALSAGNTVA